MKLRRNDNWSRPATLAAPAGITAQPGQTRRVYANESHLETCGFSFGSGKAIWNNKRVPVPAGWHQGQPILLSVEPEVLWQWRRKLHLQSNF
jgi:hypothetical protein